jgi:hypothetical protein
LVRGKERKITRRLTEGRTQNVTVDKFRKDVTLSKKVTGTQNIGLKETFDQHVSDDETEVSTDGRHLWWCYRTTRS